MMSSEDKFGAVAESGGNMSVRKTNTTSGPEPGSLNALGEGLAAINRTPVFDTGRTLLFEDDFERADGPPGAPWEIVNPGAVVENGRLKVTSMGFPRDAMVTAFDGDTSITDAVLKVDVDPVEFTNWTNASIVLRVDDLYWYAPSPKGDGIRFDMYDNVGGRGPGPIDAMNVHKIVDGRHVDFIDHVTFPELTSPFSVEASAIGDTFSFAIDGVEVFSETLRGTKSFGGFSLFSIWESTTYFDNVALYAVNGGPGPFEVEQNAPVGTVVGMAKATDSDGDTLVYAIAGGNADPDGDGTAAFAIDPVSGRITVQDDGDLDRALKEIFVLHVSATDPGGLAAIAEINISVGDSTAVKDFAQDDAITVSMDALGFHSSKWFRVAALYNDTDLLANDGGAEAIVKVNGAAINEGVWFAGDQGGEFRVFAGGVVDFRNQGVKVADGDTTGFSYTARDGSAEDTATVSLTVDAGADIARADVFEIIEPRLAGAGDRWLRLGAKKDGTGLLANDLGVDEIVFIDGRPLYERTWFDGDNGGQFRVFPGGVIDFRNQGAPLGVGDTTGFTYGILRDGVLDTARVSMTVASSDAGAGVLIKGADRDDNSGHSVACAGDADGDGLDDVIIGAFPAGHNRAGESYIIYGAALATQETLHGILDLATLDAAEGVLIKGVDGNDFSGWSAASAGDVDGDGLDDVIIGAIWADPDGADNAGESYLVYGAALAAEKAADGVIDLATLGAAEGVLIKGVDMNDKSGHSVSSAGDVDGDGLDDVIIGARAADPDGADNAGESYLVYGAALAAEKAADGVIDLATLGAAEGVLIKGADAFDFSGWSVSSAGDVDGDGVGDVIIGAYMADVFGVADAGQSYLIYGAVLAAEKTLDGVLDLATLGAADGVVIKGVDMNDKSGVSVASAGDVDGDGLDDVIIGAASADPDGIRDAGESYLVYGAVLAAEKASDGVLDLATLGAVQGVVIKGVDRQDYSGFSVASAGDVDGDGSDDIIIGARFADPDGVADAGESYLVYGAALTAEKAADGVLDLATLGPAEGVLIKGVEASDRSGVSVSSAGDVDGDGLDDVIIGAYWADPDGARNAGESYVITGAMLVQEQSDDGIIDLGDWFFG